VASLVAKSLAVPETAFGARRYRLLETTRAYALEKLVAAGETQATLRAHAGYFRKLAAESLEDFTLKPVSDEVFAARYFAEVDNFARAVDWSFGPDGDKQIGIALLSDAWPLVASRSLIAEYAALAEQAVARVDSATPPPVRARLIACYASANIFISGTRAAELAEPAIEACRAENDAFGLYTALRALGVALGNLGRDEEAADLRAEMGALVDRFPSPSRAAAIARISSRISLVSLLRGEPAMSDAIAAAISELRSFGAEGDAILYRSLQLRFFTRDAAVAIERSRALLADVRPTFNLAELVTSILVGHLMTLLAQRGRPADLDEATQLGRRYARLDVSLEGVYTLAGLAWLALKTGRAAVAGRLCGRLGRITADLGRRSPQRRLFADLEAALQVEPDEAELGRLMAEGSSLSAEDARRLVLGG
jgi:hypothetical protein